MANEIREVIKFVEEFEEGIRETISLCSPRHP